MSHPSKKAKATCRSGGPFAKRPREMLVWVLEFFTMYEVAGLQRLVCHEFRDAGQERIRERGGRKLYEDGVAFFDGLDCKTIDKSRARLLLRASREAGCKIALVQQRMDVQNLTDEDKQKILKDLKEIVTSSPYHWVDYCIGVWYKRGWGGEEKKNQAVKWLERAVHKGNTSAMCDLGVYYHNGNLGLAQSFTKANEFYALAADKGHAFARFNLGYSYHFGKGDLAIDFNRCVKLYEQSAKQGVINAQGILAEMYDLGSRDGDQELCFRWNLVLAKRGDIEAMFRIGMDYDDGNGVEQNSESAFEWYMKVAEKGDRHAQFNVGFMFETGEGVEVDLVQAMHWYQKSAAQGLQQAIDAVERLSHNQ